MKKKLYKSDDKMICGVLGGIGEYFKIDPTLIRLIYVLFSVFSAGFPGIIVYIIFAIVVPARPDGYQTYSDPQYNPQNGAGYQAPNYNDPNAPQQGYNNPQNGDNSQVPPQQ